MWFVPGLVLVGLLAFAATRTTTTSAQSVSGPAKVQMYTITLCTRVDDGPIVCPRHHP
jgi:hypothetical protein